MKKRILLLGLIALIALAAQAKKVHNRFEVGNDSVSTRLLLQDSIWNKTLIDCRRGDTIVVTVALRSIMTRTKCAIPLSRRWRITSCKWLPKQRRKKSISCSLRPKVIISAATAKEYDAWRRELTESKESRVESRESKVESRESKVESQKLRAKS